MRAPTALYPRLRAPRPAPCLAGRGEVDSETRWIMFRTSNPALKDDAFRGLPRELGAEAMTLQGTVNKTGVSLLVLIAAAAFTWSRALAGEPVGLYVLLGAIGGFCVALA